MSKKIRHHILPIFYLKGFIDPRNPPFIWLYEKGEPLIQNRSPKNIAVRKHYHSFLTTSGERDSETVENIFADMEDKAAPVIRKIINEEILDEQDRKHFARFLSYMITRVPKFRDNVEILWKRETEKQLEQFIADPEKLRPSIKKYEKEKGIKIDEQSLKKDDSEGKFKFEKDPQASLGATHIAENFIRDFIAMKWTFFKATQEYKFVTSDNPVHYVNPKNEPNSNYRSGLTDKNIEVTFPISKDCMFLGTWIGKEGYEQGNNSLVKKYTKRTIKSAQRYVYASQKLDVLSRLVQKYIDRVPQINIE